MELFLLMDFDFCFFQLMELIEQQLGIQTLPHGWYDGKSCKSERSFKSFFRPFHDTGRSEDLKMKAVV